MRIIERNIFSLCLSSCHLRFTANNLRRRNHLTSHKINTLPEACYITSCVHSRYLSYSLPHRALQALVVTTWDQIRGRCTASTCHLVLAILHLHSTGCLGQANPKADTLILLCQTDKMVCCVMKDSSSDSEFDLFLLAALALVLGFAQYSQMKEEDTWIEESVIFVLSSQCQSTSFTSARWAFYQQK